MSFRAHGAHGSEGLLLGLCFVKIQAQKNGMTCAKDTWQVSGRDGDRGQVP